MNIFFKQFKELYSEIVVMIKEGDIDIIGLECLCGLQKIFLVEDEVQCVYFIVFEKKILYCFGGMISIWLYLLNIKLINFYKI